MIHMTKKQRPPAVLITASTRRLGFAFARKCLDMGFSVIAHYRTDRGALGTWLARHPLSRNRVYFLQADLDNNPGDIVDAAVRFPVKLTGLINNAAIFTTGNLSDKTHFEKIIATNVYAPLELSRRFHQHVRSGWIINITDAHVAPMSDVYQNYRISKALLNELTRHCAFVFAPSLRVNAIAPGPVLPPRGKTRAYFAALAGKTPLRHAAHVGCIMKAFEYLVENCCVTGEILYVDSGRHLN